MVVDGNRGGPWKWTRECHAFWEDAFLLNSWWNATINIGSCTSILVSNDYSGWIALSMTLVFLRASLEIRFTRDH